MTLGDQTGNEWLWAIKFARWQHPAMRHGERFAEPTASIYHIVCVTGTAEYGHFFDHIFYRCIKYNS